MLPHRKARAVLHTVKDQCWYAGPISEKKAEEVLNTHKDTPGAFLLRDSLLPDADFFLSLLAHNGDIYHYPIHIGINQSCSLNGYTFEDLPTCVNFYTENRISGVFLLLPSFPLLNHSEIPTVRKQPVIRFATPDQHSSTNNSSRSALPHITKEAVDNEAAVTVVKDPTYASMEEGEIESLYESQLNKVNDHIYDSLISYKNEAKPAVEVVAENDCDKAVGSKEENRSFTSEVGDQQQQPLSHVFENGVKYTLPNKKVKKMADSLTATPENRFVPRFCSTQLKSMEDTEEEQQGKGVVRQLAKKLESLSVQYMVPPPPPPIPSSTEDTTHSHDPAGDKRRRPPPPPPPRRHFTLPSDNLKSSIERRPFRRGSVSDLVPSYLPTKAVPTAIVATLPRRPSSCIAGDSSMMTQYRAKQLQKYCSYPPSIPDAVEEVGSSLPSSSTASSSPISSSSSLKKKGKKSMLKRLLRRK